jgi:thiamine-phosphate pyrophosphorylase
VRDNLTEGVRRILERATALAAAESARSVAPIHLLRAMIEDESRGSEILLQNGIGSDQFSERWPGQCIEATKTSGARVRLSEISERILEEAWQLAAQAGRHAEIGSEHLLWGLSIVGSDVAEFLSESGIDTSMITGHVTAQSGFETSAIAVNEQLRTEAVSRSDRADAWRIVDAAANRCSEGVRVVEDVTRFSHNDSTASRLLKQWRHDFSALMQRLPARNRLEQRDTPRDVGTSISTRSEGERQSLVELLTANFKRAQEALRTLEETGKLLGPEYLDFPRVAEQLRYRLYTLEKIVLNARTIPLQLSSARLYLLVTRNLCALDPERVVREAIVNGVNVIQIREKSLDDGELLDYARAVRAWTREAGTLLIVNDRPDIAALCDADGVHLGQEDLPVAEARKILGSGKLIGVSTHNLEQIDRAVAEGADYLGVGPVFPSGTKQFPGYVGEEFIRQAAERIELPWFALGGIDESNLASVLSAGAPGVALCGCICSSNEPRAMAARLRATFS